MTTIREQVSDFHRMIDQPILDTPQAPPDDRARLRFIAKVDQSGGPDACHPWTGCRDRVGYGIFQRAYRRTVKAHRFAFELEHGRPPQQDILHKCGHAWCCNPKHLAEGNDEENARDRDRHGTTCRHERNGNAKLTVCAVAQLRDVRRHGATYRALVSKFGVSQTQVSRIVRGEHWVGIPAAGDVATKEQP